MIAGVANMAQILCIVSQVDLQELTSGEFDN